MPLYDANGEITGLMGFFTDRESLNSDDQRAGEISRKDLLTGLLNSRGIAEEAEAFRDEYYLRGTDFVRIHIEINDFSTINEQYGYDFGDKVLSALGHALNEAFGLRSIVGRYAGRNFTVLQQIESREEAAGLRMKIKDVGNSVREIDGKPVTLYLSVGYAFYSEYLSLEEQNKNAEMRLLADYDQSISAESRIDHALELFYMFDDLPVAYAVFHATYAEHSGQHDAVFFYVNHRYEEYFGHTAKGLFGRTVRELFPYLGDEWYQNIRSAAMDGMITEGEFDNPVNGKHYRFTARQIIYRGYCAVTIVEMPVFKPRKHLLIADDIESNREMLGDLLCEDYEILYACDGVETLEILRDRSNDIDLLILDLYMPNMSGKEVLSIMQTDKDIKSVPVIVLTVDHKAELECLKLGAMDFIPKPYPDIEIVKARIAKCIALSGKN
jgi:diguanylate cyclase (GGDEF)-like protein